MVPLSRAEEKSRILEVFQRKIRLLVKKGRDLDQVFRIVGADEWSEAGNGIEIGAEMARAG